MNIFKKKPTLKEALRERKREMANLYKSFLFPFPNTLLNKESIFFFFFKINLESCILIWFFREIFPSKESEKSFD
ncbi:hypothetical protein L1887_13785 [Cichorium endivia]|nr:hypothetical protein L1887_13785 [Cichorium endivia]